MYAKVFALLYATQGETNVTRYRLLCLLSICKTGFLLYLAVRKLYNSPLATPSPLACASLLSASDLSDPFVFAFWQANNNISLASAKREDAHTRARAHGSNGFSERGGGRPLSL
jgi:hypothetical protein